MFILLPLLMITLQTSLAMDFFPKTCWSVVLRPTSLPPWLCWNSPKSWTSRTPLLSSPKVLPPYYYCVQTNSSIYVKYLIQSLTWYLMARLWGSSYQTWKSWLPSLRKSSVKWNSIKTKYVFATPNHLYSNIGVDDSSSHFRPFSARANHCTTWF